MQIVRRWLATVIILVASLAWPAQTEAATRPYTGTYTWAAYEVQISFPKDAVQANMIVRAGPTKSGAVKSMTFPVTCATHGALSMEQERATFKSQTKDYLSCDLPSFADKVYKLTGGELQLDPIFLARDPYALANIGLTANKSWSGVDEERNPLVYHPDFQLFMPYADSGKAAYLHMFYAGLTQGTSTSFSLQTSNAIWSGNDPSLLLDFADFAGFHSFLAQHKLSKLDSSLYWANGQQLNQLRASPPFHSSSGPTTIYIGYNPETETYLDGVIERISIDPPCWAI